MHRFLNPELCGYYRGTICFISFNKPLLMNKQLELESLEESTYNSTSIDNSLLEAEDILLIKFHSTSTNNEKVRDIT